MQWSGCSDNPTDILGWSTQSAWEHVTFVVNGKDQTITTYNGGVKLASVIMLRVI